MRLCKPEDFEARHLKCFKADPGRDRGFALVVALTLMVLLSILAIGLLSLSVTTLRSTSSLDAQRVAQANARLGLIEALGRLQTTLGPDQRISARATSYAADPFYGVSVSENTPGAWWVGVTHGKEGELLPNGTKVEWLVSGVAGTDPANGSLEDPVTMFSDGSLDLDRYTGTAEIQAGRVKILNDGTGPVGSYAYYIDDEGMKAKLAPEDVDATNANNAGRGILPTGADLGELDELGALDGVQPELLAKLNSVRDLRLLGVADGVTKSRILDFTTTSFGVLSDTVRGGLRKDLTMAFENETVFEQVFPSTDKFKYTVMQEDKLNSEGSLKKNGYIHWDIFKDYYNLKKYIQSDGGSDFLDHISYEKEGFYGDEQKGDFYQGRMGPHQMTAKGRHDKFPYGEYPVMLQDLGFTGEYRHSPVSPILSFLRMNAWLEPQTENPGSPGKEKHYLRTRTQLWTGHYNPYNIGLRIKSAVQGGPRIMNFPQVVYRVPGYTEADSPVAGMHRKRETAHSGGVTLAPGRSLVMGLKETIKLGLDQDAGGVANQGNSPYSDQVQFITDQNVYNDTNSKTQRPPDPLDVRIDFVMNRSAFMHGCNENPTNKESSQFIFSPFAWDLTKFINGDEFPGKKFEYQASHAELGFNNTSSITMALRTTNEGGNSIRPLVDANVRAPWVNPKWDFGLGLPAPAAYNATDQGEPFSRDIEMSHADAPKGYSYLGSGESASEGFDRVILYDVPREDLVSLGQLQHANAGRFSYEPSYIVGNSYANPRIPLEDWKEKAATDNYSPSAPGSTSTNIAGTFELYDASYLVNEVLWDSYIFTTLPQEADNHSGTNASTDYPALLAGDEMLPNPRFLPYEPRGSSFDQAVLQEEGDATKGAFFHNAGHLLVDGAFNINSTSIEAWEAFLNSSKGLPVQKIDSSGTVTTYDETVERVRFPRVKASYGGGVGEGDDSGDFWTGYRELEKEEVRELATAIVGEIKKRGPFHGLADFVNRDLVDGERGASGVLQAALDQTVNADVSSAISSTATHPALPADQSQAAGYPGQLLQGDLLQALSPYMSARSDTFTIRAYGEAIDPTGKISASAWCEAVVQRVPDAVGASGLPASGVLQELANPSDPFGRKFVIRSFRWLNPSEI